MERMEKERQNQLEVERMRRQRLEKEAQNQIEMERIRQQHMERERQKQVMQQRQQLEQQQNAHEQRLFEQQRQKQQQVTEQSSQQEIKFSLILQQQQEQLPDGAVAGPRADSRTSRNSRNGHTPQHSFDEAAEPRLGKYTRYLLVKQ